MIRTASRLLLAGLFLALTPTALHAQHGSHVQRVHIGKGGWVTPEQALAKGYILHQERWVPKKLKSKLKKWAKADAKINGFKDAYRVKTKHYRIKTNAPRHIVEVEIAPFLDELYRTYVKVFREDFGLKGKAADKNHINIYWGFPAWRDEEDNNRGNPGYYQPGGALTVMYDAGDADDFFNTVFHEGAHQFFTATLPGAELPIWLDEALAVYFEGCTFSPSTSKITPIHIPRDRLAHAQEAIAAAKKAGEPLTPEAMFMQYKGDDFDAGHYALAWSYLYFLVNRDDGKHKKDFYKFLKEMNGSGAKSVYRVFKEATRKDLTEIEKGWVPFVMSLKLPPEHSRMVLVAKNGGGLFEKEDQLIMINGVDINTEALFEKHWVERDKTKPAKLLLLREFNRKDGFDYELKFVTVELPADTSVALDYVDVMPFMQNVVH